jgi:hypothetical protein
MEDNTMVLAFIVVVLANPVNITLVIQTPPKAGEVQVQFLAMFLGELKIAHWIHGDS